MSAYALSDIVLNSGDAAEFVIHQIENLQHSQNGAVEAILGSGGVAPVGHTQNESEPQSTITTTDTSLLALNSNKWLARGYCADQASSTVPFNKKANCGTFDAASVHGGMLIDGIVMVVPTSITGTKAETVKVNADLKYLAGPLPISPTTLDVWLNPVQKVTSAALRTASYQETSQLANAFVRGVELPDLVSFTYTPAFTVEGKSQGGGTYHSEAYINAIGSTFEFVVEDLDRAMDAITGAGTKAGGGTIIYLAKKKSGGSIEPLASTVHKSITALSGMEITETITSQAGQNGSGTIKISLDNPDNSDDGDLVTVASGVAIP